MIEGGAIRYAPHDQEAWIQYRTRIYAIASGAEFDGMDVRSVSGCGSRRRGAWVQSARNDALQAGSMSIR